MEENTQDSGESFDQVAADVSNEQIESHSEQSLPEGSQVQEEQNVPLSALKSERAQRQQMQEELQVMKDNLRLMQSQQQSQTPKKDEWDGLSDDDVMTVGEYKKFIEKERNQMKVALTEVQMTQKYPDYREVVTKYLPDVIKSNPRLRDTLEQTQDYELAYYLARNSDTYKEQNKKAKKNADAQRLVKNASKPGNLSSMGQNTPVSAVKSYKNMSDSDFMKQVNQNLGYF